MLELAAAQTPERVRREYVDVYRELRAAGYTAVGEFHYLGLEEGRAAAEAAAEAGIELVLLHVAYARGGIGRVWTGWGGARGRAAGGPRGRRRCRGTRPPLPPPGPPHDAGGGRESAA